MSFYEFLVTHKVAAIWVMSAVLTWAFKPCTPEQYLALPSKLAATLKFVSALGIDVPKLREAIVELVFGVPKPPAAPPAPPAPPLAPSGDTYNLDEETDPHLVVDAQPPTAARVGLFERLAFGAVMTGWIVVGLGVVSCGALGSNVTTYAPTPEQEMGVVSFGGAAEACALLDSGKANELACLHEVECEHGHAEAGTCDAGSNANELLASCVHGGGAYVCTTNTDCVCRAKADASTDAAADAKGGAR